MGKAFFLFEDQADQFFGFGTGDEGAGIALEVASHELDLADNVLQRDALAAFLESLADGGKLLFGERTVEFEVKLNPSEAEKVAHNSLHIETGFADSLFLKIACSAVYYL